MKEQIVGVGRTAEVIARGEDKVIKLFYPWMDREWVEYEWQAVCAAQAAGLAVPHVYDRVEEGGRLGIVFERVHGKTMLQLFREQPSQIFDLVRRMGQLHAQMHTISAPDLPQQKQVYHRSIGRAVKNGLPENMVEPVQTILASLEDGCILCHADFHPDNIVLTERGPVILDWMTAQCGNPAGDIARTWLLLTMGRAPGEPPKSAWMKILTRLAYRGYLAGYRSVRSVADRDIQVWKLPVLAARLVEGIESDPADMLPVMKRLMVQTARSRGANPS